MPQGGREWSYRPAPAIRVPIKPVDLYNANTLGLTCQVEKDRKGKEPSSLPAPLISRSSSYLHQVRQASREHTVGTRLVARHTTSGGVHDHGQVSRKPGHKPDWKARPRSWPAEQGEHMRIRTQVSRLSGVRHAPGPGSQQRAPATGRLLPVGLRPEGRWAGTRERTEGRGAKLYNYLCPSGGHIKRTHTHTHTQRHAHT